MGPSSIIRTVLKCRNWGRLWNILVIFAYLWVVSILSSESSSSSGMWAAQALEMNVGKIPSLEAVNGSTVMLPCTYLSCIGIKNLYFNWQFNDNGTMRKVHHTEEKLSCSGLSGSFGRLTACCSFQVCESVIPSEGVVPHVTVFWDRVEFVGKNYENNISILLSNITFEDGGQYTCFGRNPKEKGKNHSAIFTLIVVYKCEWLGREPIDFLWLMYMISHNIKNLFKQWSSCYRAKFCRETAWSRCSCGCLLTQSLDFYRPSIPWWLWSLREDNRRCNTTFPPQEQPEEHDKDLRVSSKFF